MPTGSPWVRVLCTTLIARALATSATQLNWVYAWIGANVVIHNLLRDCNNIWEPKEFDFIDDNSYRIENIDSIPERVQGQQGQLK